MPGSLQCPVCGMAAGKLRCPRCNALKVKSCAGGCIACRSGCSESADTSVAKSAPRHDEGRF